MTMSTPCSRSVGASATAVPDHPRLVEMLARLRAACPEDARRDGPAAMALAKGLMDSKSDINSAVTQAMALAEVGRFAEAEALQAEALRVALAENRPDLEPSLTYFLDLYKAGKPARELWAQARRAAVETPRVQFRSVPRCLYP